jgi:hypothetical protein
MSDITNRGEGAPAVPSRSELDAFLADLKTRTAPSTRGRLVFALDATASREATWKGSDTVTAVTFALRAFASPIPWSTAFFDSSDPSVGIRICLYILQLPQIMCEANGRSSP